MLSRTLRLGSKSLLQKSCPAFFATANQFNVNHEALEANPKIPASLKASDFLLPRHLGPNENEMSKMLNTLGVSSLQQLIEETIPASILMKENYLENSAAITPIPAAKAELLALNSLREIAKKNKIFKSYIGCGFHPTIMPKVILRNVFENPAWYTSYTPYQAECSQGRLEALLHFQTMIMELTKLDIANASLLDEATAAAEAMYMCNALHDGEKKTFVVSKDCFPQNISLVKTRGATIGVNVEVVDPMEFNFADRKDISGVLLQNPDNNGKVHDYTELIQKIKASGASVAIAADIMSLAIMKPPGKMGADIAFGATQRFGLPMSFGGPNAAYFATRDELKRKMPGRIIGISVDNHGSKALRMALGTREQHIKREKATSNICTAQALTANMAGFYGIYHGPKGLEQIANRIRKMAQIIQHSLKHFKYKLITDDDMIFDTITVDLRGFKKNAAEMQAIFAKNEINIRVIDETTISVSVNEATTLGDLQELLHVFDDVYGSIDPIEKVMNLEGIESSGILKPIPKAIKRVSPFMQQDIYNNIHSESQMLRFLYKLQLKDLSLTSSMTPLGSCTMKASPTSIMIPITWPEFTEIHPFAPKDQVGGYLEMINKLKDYIKSITGFDGVSLQPNSGAQGELAGLLTIKKYYQDMGHSERNICLIPVSAHGTNPASCVLAGLNLVTVKCDSHGNVDINDLTEKAKKHSANLCCLMITYPSTHGVFEEGIKDIVKIIHDNGGQVYMDGANMNAQCGLTSPGYIGADVCHLNLHKTFGMPHGGGGPGVGPIAVRKHLTPYLPSNVVSDPDPEGKSFGSIASAQHGSAGLLPISYMYIEGLGKEGVRDATAKAILNSNYLLTRLKKEFKVLFVGSKGRCAHEFIIDLRPFKKFGVTEEDVAKRLMDYGFHSPTMSFPVPGTLMIEPTESEDQGELDRFCDALLEIKKEIDEIAGGKMDKANNPLKNAPHCLEHVTGNEWKHPYSREKAAFPLPYIKARGKFWPTVGRVNNLIGDKKLCPSFPSDYKYI